MTDTVVNIFNPPPPAPAAPAAHAPELGAQGTSRRRLQAFMNPGRQPIRADIPSSKGDALTATIRLYDPIDSYGEWWGVSAKEFASVLDELPDTVTEIRLLINSPGGECTEGMAILNLLRNHPAKVIGIVEGLAASAASFVAVGCDELHMNRNSELLIHDAWGLCIGNAADMREFAAELDHLSDNLASVYATKAGGTIADWRAVMATDTWYSAEEAVGAGLADSVLEPASSEPAPAARFDRSIFARSAPAPEPKSSATPPSPSPTPGREGESVMDLTEIRDALGLADDTSDEDIILAALERLTAPPEPPEPAPAAELPDGVVAISEQQLADLQADAQAGREARQTQITAERESLVEAAVSDGRIAPAERDGWLAKLEAGTGAEQVLATLTPGLIPVNQLGSGGALDLDSDEAVWAELGFNKEVKA